MRKLFTVFIVLLTICSFAQAQRKQERGYNVYLWGAAADGTTDDKVPIDRLDDWANAEGLVLYFPTGTYRIGSDLTIDSDCEFETSAQLNIDGGATVTFNGLIKANQEQIFTGSGSVVLTAQAIVHAAWWGGGNFVGFSTTGPDRVVDILDATNPQLRLTHTDGTKYTDFQTTSAGDLYISTSGDNVGIGTASPSRTLSNTKILELQSDVNANIEIAASGSGTPKVTALRSQGSQAAKSAVVSGRTLFSLEAHGWDGSAYIPASSILFSVDTTPGTSDMPGNIRFYTTPNGGFYSLERLRIDNAGNVGIGTNTPAARLAVNGGVHVGGDSDPGDDNIIIDGVVKISGGSPGIGKVLVSDADGDASWGTVGGGAGNAVYVEEGDAARIDTTAADGYIDFDGSDFDVATAGNEANVTVNDAGIDHDASTNFVADEHVAHSGVTLTAGAGLSGGGDISASRTFTFDPTEVNSITWGDGTQSTIPMAFDMAAGDQTLTAGNGKLTASGNVVVAGVMKIEGGSPGAAKVLTSDASGNATWVTPAAGATGNMVLVKSDATASNQTVSLPTAVGITNTTYTVIKTDPTSHTVTVDPNGAETADGANNIVLRRQWESWTGVSDNANWFTVSRNGQIVNVQDFGATGDGTTDDTTAINAAFTAASTGDTVFFPRGHYKVTSAISVTKNVNILGNGLGSQIFQSTDNNLFELSFMADSTVGHMYLGSAATTSGKSLIQCVTNVHRTKFESITMEGSYYGIHLKGAIECSFEDLVANTGLTFFGSCSSNQYWVYAETYGGFSSNGHCLYNPNLSSGVNGIYVVESNSQGSIHIFGGTIEGLSGYGVYLSGCGQGSSINGVHFEADVAAAIKLASCSGVSIRDCYTSTKIDLVSSNQVTITGGYATGSIYVNKWCKNVNISNVRFNGGGIVGDCAGLNVSGWADASNEWNHGHGTHTPNFHVRNLVDGDLEVWTGSVPLGFTSYGTNALTEENTIVKFGSASAKVEVAAGQTMAALQHSFSAARLLRPFRTVYRTSTYSWTLSGSGTNEYYVRLAAGTNPSILASPQSLWINSALATEGTVGSLAAGRWGYGNNDSLGYNTIYVRLSDGSDPDSKAAGYIYAMHKLAYATLSAWAYKPETDGVNPKLYMNYGGSCVGITITIPPDEWTKVHYSMKLATATGSVTVLWGVGVSGAAGSPGDVCYFDGLELHEGIFTSPVYDDSRGLDGNFRVGGTILAAGEVSTMTGNETFAWGDGNTFVKDPGGDNRTLNPSGSFPALVQITLVNTADASETIYFDSTGLNESVGQGQRAIFVYDGSTWLKIYNGS